MKRHVRPLRCHRRTGRATVDSGRAYAHEEDTVEAFVSRRDRTVVALVLIGIELCSGMGWGGHTPIMHGAGDMNRRKSDIDTAPTRDQALLSDVAQNWA